MNIMNINWHRKAVESQSTGQKLADRLARIMGSWGFIVFQTLFISSWIILNVVAYLQHWDTYPFVLLNLLFSLQAAFAAPIIMMSQNRQTERDRIQAEADYQTNIDAKREIEEIQERLKKIESEKLDEILRLLRSH